MTGFLLPPASRGTRRSCSRSRKRQTRRRRNPSSFVASCPTLLPFACVPGASPITLAFSPVVAHRSQHRWRSLCAESAAGPSCASNPSGSLSPPGPLLGVRELPFPSVFYSCGAHPKVLKVAL
uniref:Uncharacterized protein n=1 Tax=Capra hircus TaxID=9925 RepID=A0A8C2RBX1_CAPHI